MLIWHQLGWTHAHTEHKNLDGKENLFHTAGSLSRTPLDGAAYPFSRKKLTHRAGFQMLFTCCCCCPFAKLCLIWGTPWATAGEGNGNPLQYACLENPRDGRAWWAAVYGVSQSGCLDWSDLAAVAAPWATACRLLCPPLSLKFAQIRVHWVSNAIQPSHCLLSPFPPAFHLGHESTLKNVLQHHSSKF